MNTLIFSRVTFIMYSFCARILGDSSDVVNEIHKPINEAIKQLYPHISDNDFKTFGNSVRESIIDMMSFSIEQDEDESGGVLDVGFRINIDKNRYPDNYGGDTESVISCGMCIYINVSRDY